MFTSNRLYRRNLMRKTKKILVAFLLTLLCVTIFALVGCSSQGKQGEKGQDSLTGKSAYEIWIDNGHSGSESDFLEWLKGTDGANGKDGQNGLKGDTGETGPQGPQGEKGDTGNDGQNGTNGLSAYEIFLKYNPDYTGTEEQWINGLVSNQLIRYTITFESEVHEDIIKTAFYGLPLLDIPEVPEKEGQETAIWDKTDFSRITEDLTVTAVYTMKQFTVTFHNEFTDDDDIIKTVAYGEAITDIPAVTEKVGNDGYWNVKDFSRITSNIFVNTVYETKGLSYSLYDNSGYGVSKGNMSTDLTELFIPAEYNGKPVVAVGAVGADMQAYEFQGLPLTRVWMTDNVKKLCHGAFVECEQLENVRLSNNITELPGSMFWHCSSLKSIELPNNLKYLDNCFSYSGIEYLVIPNSVIGRSESFDWITMDNCPNLKWIVVPDKVICALSYNKILTAVFYRGSNNYLENFKGNTTWTENFSGEIYNYSESQPTDNGNYWHYDSDGITPIVWNKETANEETI